MNYFRTPLIAGIAALCMYCCAREESNKVPEGGPLPVKVLTVSNNAENQTDTYVGTAEASQTIPLSFLTTGAVERVLVNEGETVNKGQLLASLNSSSYQNAYLLATAKEKQAMDAYDRLSSVYKNGSLPEIKMVEIESGLEQAKSAAGIAKKNLDDCKVCAPMDGIIGKKNIEPGMNVVPGITIMTLVKIDKIFIKVPVPENEISALGRGQMATVIVPALNNQSFTGTIELKGVIANPLSHTYEVKIAIANHNKKIIPGMVCNVIITRTSETSCISIPQHIIQIDPAGHSYVFTVDTSESKAVRKPIKTGRLFANGLVEVVSGLAAGDAVIKEGYQKVNQGTKVQIIL
jgi:RND family efflux transporter MFP subunit